MVLLRVVISFRDIHLTNTECEQEALSAGHKRALSLVVHVVNERDDEKGRKGERDVRQRRKSVEWRLPGGQRRCGCNRLNECLEARPMANPRPIESGGARLCSLSAPPLQRSVWSGPLGPGSHLSLRCCERPGLGGVLEMLQGGVTDGSTIK